MPQFPLYTTRGEWAAQLVDGYLYNNRGDWVGFIDKDSQIFSISGEYVGWLSKDFRILRKRDTDEAAPRRPLPARPPLKIQLPASAPLPRLMAELNFDTVDVLDEMPERLYPVGADPLAKDID
jgi:hypothetical protein